MVVSDEVVLVVLLAMLNYLLLYRKNTLVGSLVFFLMGLGTFMLIDTTYGWIGLGLAFIGGASFLYDAFGKSQMGKGFVRK